MKHVGERPYADPEAAARKLIELAASIEPVQDGRIHIEKINAPFLYALKARGAEFGAGIDYAVKQGLARIARDRHLCAAAGTGPGPAQIITSVGRSSSRQ
ncbi:hypothetical protein ABIB83_005488 [Bradyrhizobium sp. I1.8.5]